MYIDFETYSAADIRKSGADAYARHHSTGVLCMAYAMTPQDRARLWIPGEQIDRAGGADIEHTTELPLEVVAHVANGGRVTAHNAAFDAAIWNHCLLGAPQIQPEQIDCTMGRALAMALPASLGLLGDALSINMPKDKMGTRLINRMCKPPFETSPLLLTAMAHYCARDVDALIEIEGKLRPLSDDERMVWLVNHKANQAGLYLDTELINNCLKLSQQADEHLAAHAQSIAGLTPAQLRSPKQLLAWCSSQGVELPSLNKATLATAVIDNPVVQQVLDIREQVCRASIKKFTAMLAVLCPDGRARGNHVYHKATTGRFAGSGIQIQNLPRPVIDDPDGTAETVASTGKLPGGLNTDTKTALSSLLRSCIMAPYGFEFYCSDFSSIESRVLFWLAGDDKGLQVYKDGDDLYCVTASGIFGRPVTKKDDPDARMIGKIAVLSLGYGGGVKAFTGMCEAFGVDLKGQDPQAIVTGYRETYDTTRQFWYNCEATAMEAVNTPGTIHRLGRLRFKYSTKVSALVCELPSGRLIHWPRAEIDPNGTTPWGATKEQIAYMGMNLNHKWSTQRTYGGDIAQSCTQAVARDMLTAAMCRMDAAGFKVVLHVHDEVMVEQIKSRDRYSEFTRLMSTLPAWAKGLPVEASGWRGKRYQK